MDREVQEGVGRDLEIQWLHLFWSRKCGGKVNWSLLHPYFDLYKVFTPIFDY